MCDRREYEIYNATWQFPIRVIVGGDRDDANEFAESLLGSIEKEYSSPTATTWMNDKVRGIIIWFKNEPTPGIASHEALHAIAQIMRLTRLPFEEATEEAFCYLLQWIVNEILDEAKQHQNWSYVI